MVSASDNTDNVAIGSWQLLCTNVKNELEKARGLRDRGYVAYLPRMCQRGRVYEGVGDVTGALFARYRFAAPGYAGQPIASVGSTPSYRTSSGSACSSMA